MKIAEEVKGQTQRSPNLISSRVYHSTYSYQVTSIISHQGFSVISRTGRQNDTRMDTDENNTLFCRFADKQHDESLQSPFRQNRVL